MTSLQTPIKAEESPLRDILSSNKFLFIIPTYQRPLSWEEDNFEKLFTDIYDSMKESEGENPYFLGSMVFYNKEENKYEVIDGQQRLVSLIVLLSTVRDLIKNEGYKQTLQNLVYQSENPLLRTPRAERVTPWEDLKEYFENYIYAPGKIRQFIDDCEKKKIIYKDEDDPIYHLYECAKTFYRLIDEQFSKLDRQRDFELFTEYLLNNVYVVHIRTSNMTSAIRLFNVLNDRGLPLSSIDIIKSVNLEAINDKTRREDYAKKWIALERELGREELENLVSHIRTIKTNEKAKSTLQEEYEVLYRNKKLQKGENFFDYMAFMADLYKNKIIDPKVEIKGEAQRNRYRVLVNLMSKCLPFNDWIPPILAFLEKYGQNNEFIVAFMNNLEKKAFVEWTAGFTRTERITSFSRIVDLIEKSTEPKVVIDKMLTYKPKEIERGRFIDFTKANEINKILDLINDEHFYMLKGGKLAKYVMLRLDMEKWDLAVFPGYPGQVTVEHILPQTPPSDSEWLKKFGEKDRKEWTNKLGNLVLLSGSKNSRAGNLDFKEKKDIYFKEKCSPFKLTEEILHVQDWTASELTRRHENLTKKLRELYTEDSLTLKNFI